MPSSTLSAVFPTGPVRRGHIDYVPKFNFSLCVFDHIQFLLNHILTSKTLIMYVPKHGLTETVVSPC